MSEGRRLWHVFARVIQTWTHGIIARALALWADNGSEESQQGLKIKYVVLSAAFVAQCTNDDKGERKVKIVLKAFHRNFKSAVVPFGGWTNLTLFKLHVVKPQKLLQTKCVVKAVHRHVTRILLYAWQQWYYCRSDRLQFDTTKNEAVLK